MGFLKPKAAKSSSQNVNNSLITSTYTPQAQAGVGATNVLQSLLTGQGDTQAAQQGYNSYLKNAGYSNALQQLQKGVVGQGAASGLLNSGATQNRLLTRGAELNQGFFNNYLQNLNGLSGLGLQAGGLIANTGQQSQSKGGGPSTLGSIGSAVGGIASIFSDRRLKHSIRKVGEFADGLGIYVFSYLGSRQRIRGVMADEVEKLRPWALGPVVGGYATVNYGAL